MGRKRTAPDEIELKFEVDPSRIATWRSHGFGPVASGPGETATLVSTYFDTEDHGLREEGMSFRIRRIGDRRVQTVKKAGRSGLFKRQESEAEIEGDAPQTALIADPDLRAVVEAAGEILPLFESRIERTIWQTGYAGSQIEIALDEGEVVSGDLRLSVAELELELKRGAISDLFALARAIATDAELRLGVSSKSDRGYQLLTPRTTPAVKADPTRLPKRANVAEAFQAIGRTCLRHYRLNEPELLSARAPECLHQARVALRRLRAAFTLFKSVVADPEGLRLKAELKAVAKLLGRGRDLDVYLARLEAHAADNPLEPGIVELRDRIRGQRVEAYNLIVERLCLRGTAQLFLDLSAWIEAGDWLADPDKAAILERPAAEFAADILDKRWGRLRKKGCAPSKLDPDARHQVRIDAKKLRYAVEFFTGLFPDDKARRRRQRLLTALEALQETLGELNDIVSGHAMANDLARTPGLALRAEESAILFALGRFSAEQDERTATLLDRASAAHESLRDAKPFWA